MSVFSSVKRILSLVLFIPVIAYGQASLRGTITDAANNETLIGVNVVVMGTSLGAATDIEGQFRIVGIPERLFNIKVSCIGYEAQIIEVDFSKTKDVQKHIQMKSAIIEGEEVVITAQLRGQLAAINQQITSNRIVNVVSEEKIQQLPDANAAEAIGRLPGVSLIRSGGEATNVVLRGLSSKFSNITIDGVKVPPTNSNTRDVDLSMMSQGALAGIELFKTLTPDQDADAIAGTVNLVTRKAPSERLIRLDLKGGYNSLLKTSNQYDFAGRYGERFFDDMIGVQLQANIEKKNRSSEQTATRYLYINIPPDDPYAVDYNMNQFQVNFTDQIRKREGGQIIIDVNTPDSGSVKLTGLYSSTNTFISTYMRNYVLQGGGGAWDYNFQYQEFGVATANVSLQGKNHLFGLDLDWNMSYAHSKGTNPYDFIMTFMEAGGGGAGMPELRKDHPEYLTPYAVNNYSMATCSSSVYNEVNNFDKEITAFLNLSKTYTLGSLMSGEVKGGGKYKHKSRWMSQLTRADNNQLHGLYTDGLNIQEFKNSRFKEYYLTRSGMAPLLSDFIDYPVATRDLLGLYRMNPIINMDAIRQWYAFTKDTRSGTETEFTTSALGGVNGYGTKENVTSAFIMNTLNIGQSITFISGLRVESEENDYLGHYSLGMSVIGLVVKGVVKDSVTHYNETIWLPNAQLVIRPTDFLTVRLAGYRALARPDYNMRLPRFSTSNGTPTPYTLGNTDLRNVKAWNFEVNTQVFSGTLGLISVTAFYKKIDDLFHMMTNLNIGSVSGNPAYNDSVLTSMGITWQKTGDFKTVMTTSTGVNASYTLPYNSPGPSYAWGFELEHQTSFGFISKSLTNLTLSYNVSITRSETQIITSAPYQPYFIVWSTSDNRWIWDKGTLYNQAKVETRQSENQPNLYGNCSIGYEIGGFSARVSVYYQDEAVQSYSAIGQTDVHTNAFSKWDIALKQELSKTVMIFLNIDNLNNHMDATSQVNTQANWNLTRNQQLYGTTADFGIRLLL